MKTFVIVKFALVPFSFFWFLLGAGHPAWAIFAALALSAAGNAWRASQRQFVGLEAGAFALFLALGTCELLAPAFAAANALWLSFAGLSAISLASVAARRPWTADYSRLAYPENAATPQFRMINAAITGLWGVLFLALALAGISRFRAMSAAPLLAWAPWCRSSAPAWPCASPSIACARCARRSNGPRRRLSPEAAAIATLRLWVLGSEDYRPPPISRMPG